MFGIITVCRRSLFLAVRAPAGKCEDPEGHEEQDDDPERDGRVHPAPAQHDHDQAERGEPERPGELAATVRLRPGERRSCTSAPCPGCEVDGRPAVSSTASPTV